MPNIKSAEKRMRQSRVNRSRNVSTKNALRTLRRKFDDSLETADTAAVETLFRDYCSNLDKAVKRGIVKKNTADRSKQRAALRMKKAAKPA
jgi:small subunit ribosomal protein S20